MRLATTVIALLLGAAPFALEPALAQQGSPPKKSATVKAGKGEKVCRVRMQYTGEVRTWVCKIDEPCCVWHEINYVKCGSPVFKCL